MKKSYLKILYNCKFFAVTTSKIKIKKFAFVHMKYDMHKNSNKMKL